MDNQIYPTLLKEHINTVLLPSLLNVTKKTISKKISQCWLYHLGYYQKQHMKGVYWDGHECKDVKACRVEYLVEINKLKK